MRHGFKFLAMVACTGIACWSCVPIYDGGFKSGKSDPIDRVTIATSHARRAEESGDFSGAERLWTEILKRAEATNDAELIQLADYSLSKVYAQSGMYGKAIPYYQRFLEIKRGEAPDAYHGLAWNLAEIGDLYFNDEQWEVAVSAYQESLSLLNEYARVPDTIIVLHKLALCYWKLDDLPAAQMKFREAESNYAKAIVMPAAKIRRNIIDVDFVTTLEDWAAFAAATGTQGAKQLHERVAAIWSDLRRGSKLGASASEAEILESIARHYCVMGRHIDAMIVYDRLFDLEIGPPPFKASSFDRARLETKIAHLKNQCLDLSRRYNHLSDKEKQDNPYLAEFNSLMSEQQCFNNRQLLCQKYAWSVPTAEALDVLMQHQPLIEIGAGTGYWASLVRKKGGQIVSCDVLPVPSKGNLWHARARGSWTEVVPGDETMVRRYGDHTLFMSWPPETNRCAYNALRFYSGKFLIYVGEGKGGCTGTKEFHELLAKDWQLIKQVDIPQCPGVYDALFIYERKQPFAGEVFGKQDAAESKGNKAILGERLASVVEKSRVVSDDLNTLLNRGIKVRFVKGKQGGYYDRKSKTISIPSTFSDGEKMLAISHEYAHVVLNPTDNPIPGITGRNEFILKGFNEEADAVIHQLIAAQELKSEGVALDKSTLQLLSDYQKNGPDAALRYIDTAKNSASEEDYVEHFSRWYDEVVPKSQARP